MRKWIGLAVLFAVLAPAGGTLAAGAPAAIGWRVVPMPGNAHTAEPTLAIGLDGTIYITAPGDPGDEAQGYGPYTGVIWRSTDGGHRFAETGVSSPPWGGGDSSVDVLPDGSVNVDAQNPAYSEVFHATDGFADPSSARSSMVGNLTTHDRPWLGHHCDLAAYLVYHDVALGGQEWLDTSTDGGVTWTTAPTLISTNIAAPGLSPAGMPPPTGSGVSQLDSFGSSGSGPVVVDQATGQIYVAYAVGSLGAWTYTNPDQGTDQSVVVATSTDGGTTFRDVYAYSGASGSYTELFPWITLDMAGNVYAGWWGNLKHGDDYDAWYAWSNDHAQTWSHPIKLDGDPGTHIFTTIAAGDPGVLDAAWLSTPAHSDAALNGNNAGTAPTGIDWYVDFAQVTAANTSAPRITRSRITPTPMHQGNVCDLGGLCQQMRAQDRSLLDFISIAIGPDGLGQVAWSATSGVPAGTTPSDESYNQVMWAQQIGGHPAFTKRYSVCGHAIGVAPAAATVAAAPPAQAAPAAPRTPLPNTAALAASLGLWLLLAVSLGGLAARMLRDPGPPRRR